MAKYKLTIRPWKLIWLIFVVVIGHILTGNWSASLLIAALASTYLEVKTSSSGEKNGKHGAT
jgi:hypothetical protein